MKAAERIGVFICECGPNIKDAVDMDGVVEFAQGLEHVVFNKLLGLLFYGNGK
jgi:heterodisulfide reductase subunit A-like polyferredoxin